MAEELPAVFRDYELIGKISQDPNRCKVCGVKDAVFVSKKSIVCMGCLKCPFCSDKCLKMHTKFVCRGDATYNSSVDSRHHVGISIDNVNKQNNVTGIQNFLLYRASQLSVEGADTRHHAFGTEISVVSKYLPSGYVFNYDFVEKLEQRLGIGVLLSLLIKAHEARVSNIVDILGRGGNLSLILTYQQDKGDPFALLNHLSSANLGYCLKNVTIAPANEVMPDDIMDYVVYTLSNFVYKSEHIFPNLSEIQLVGMNINTTGGEYHDRALKLPLHSRTKPLQALTFMDCTLNRSYKGKAWEALVPMSFVELFKCEHLTFHFTKSDVNNLGTFETLKGIYSKISKGESDRPTVMNLFADMHPLEFIDFRELLLSARGKIELDTVAVASQFPEGHSVSPLIKKGEQLVEVRNVVAHEFTNSSADILRMFSPMRLRVDDKVLEHASIEFVGMLPVEIDVDIPSRPMLEMFLRVMETKSVSQRERVTHLMVSSPFGVFGLNDIERVLRLFGRIEYLNIYPSDADIERHVIKPARSEELMKELEEEAGVEVRRIDESEDKFNIPVHLNIPSVEMSTGKQHMVWFSKFLGAKTKSVGVTLDSEYFKGTGFDSFARFADTLAASCGGDITSLTLIREGPDISSPDALLVFTSGITRLFSNMTHLEIIDVDPVTVSSGGWGWPPMFSKLRAQKSQSVSNFTYKIRVPKTTAITEKEVVVPSAPTIYYQEPETVIEIHRNNGDEISLESIKNMVDIFPNLEYLGVYVDYINLNTTSMGEGEDVETTTKNLHKLGKIKMYAENVISVVKMFENLTKQRLSKRIQAELIYGTHNALKSGDRSVEETLRRAIVNLSNDDGSEASEITISMPNSSPDVDKFLTNNLSHGMVHIEEEEQQQRAIVAKTDFTRN